MKRKVTTTSHANGPPAAVGPAKRALVLVPGCVNYFYDRAGSRIAAALRGLGVRVDVHTLQSAPSHTPGGYDWCFLVNQYEVGVGYGDQAAAMRRISLLRRDVGRCLSVLLECAKTHWFANVLRLCRETGVDTLLDLGFHDQSADVPVDARGLYRFAFNGLHAAERAAVRRTETSAVDRPLPWVFVGHLSSERLRLVDLLIREADPGGVVYLPHLAPFTDDGPHLNERQLQALLGRTRFHIWCSHHSYFYMESERFRDALLAGCLPLKVLAGPAQAGPGVPFDHLLVRDTDLGTALRSTDFHVARRRYVDAFCARPSLEQSLAEVLEIGQAARHRAESEHAEKESVPQWR